MKETLQADAQLDNIIAWLPVGVFTAMSAACLAAIFVGVYIQFCAKNQKKQAINIDDLAEEEDRSKKVKKTNMNNSHQKFMIEDLEDCV
jgi:hypothetical protein